jgi:hypothetical protein
MVCVAEPETVNVKSSAIPDSATDAPVVTVLLVTVRLPA